ncbi:MAG: hypothetical protein EAX91_12815 [Candidatus Lokiarchaeota archaeon]|nr:hypothetical protein [Candidatus Lokiarchaeota archaeon]
MINKNVRTFTSQIVQTLSKVYKDHEFVIFIREITSESIEKNFLRSDPKSPYDKDQFREEIDFMFVFIYEE